MTKAPDINSVTLPTINKDQDAQYNLLQIFGNANPVELELGIGKGRFLIQQAQGQPDTNFIGVEWANKYFKLVAERAAKRGLTNIRVLRDDALHTVQKTLANESLSALHVYFPDPWPKARHLKRRLIQPPFARTAAKLLKDNAEVFLATDFENYAQQMEEVFLADPDFEQTLRAVGQEAPEGVTNWEVKFRAEGRTIHKFNFRRKSRA